ncbi:hypothetical protein AAC387_Pa01g2892 [Persea americana]
MVEAIRSKLMEFFELRRLKSHVLNSKLTRYAQSMLSKESEHARKLGVCAANPTEIEVHYSEYVDVIHLDCYSCTCSRWELLGIPCSHAVAALKMRVLDSYDNYEQWFTSDIYRRTYNFVIHGTRDMNQWDVRTGSHVFPPYGKRQAGRPKKNIIRTEDRRKNKVTCSRCKQKGHNRQTCRNPPIQN